MTITVSSTTETQEALQEAANYGLKTAQAATPDAETEEHPEAEQAETGAESETAQQDEGEPEPEEEEEEEKEEEEPPAAAKPVGKTRAKLLRRLGRLHSENLTLQEQLEEAQTKLRRLEGGDKPLIEPAPTGKPNPKDYTNYEDYVEALADYKIKERDQQRAKAAQDEYLKSIFDDYNQQIEAAREAHDDFDEVVGRSDRVPIIAINAMYECDNGAEVAYYLGQHPEVRAELLEWNEPGVKGGVRKILAKLDKISEDLSSPSKRSAPVNHQPRTAAPAPIRPVGTGASTRSTVDPGKLPYQEYVKWHERKYGKGR